MGRGAGVLKQLQINMITFPSPFLLSPPPSPSPLSLLTVGARNHTSLSKDSLPSCRDTNWSSGRCGHHWKTPQSQTKTCYNWLGWETCQRIASCEVRGVFSSDTERLEKCVWRGHPGCSRAPRARQETKVHALVSTRATILSRSTTAG